MKLLNKLSCFFNPTTGQQAYDRQLLVVVFILMAVGLVIVASASMPEGIALSADPFRFLKRHLLYLVLCLLLLSGCVCIPMQSWYNRQTFLLILAFLGLLAVLLVGTEVNGSHRWLRLGPLNMQPSEFAKLALLLALARYLTLKKVTLRDIKSLVVPGLLFLMPFMLVLKQPDLSTALVFAVMTLFMLYWAGLATWEIFILISPILSVILTFHQLLWALLFVILFAVMWMYRVNLFMLLTTLLVNMAAGYSSIMLWNRVLKEHQREK